MKRLAAAWLVLTAVSAVATSRALRQLSDDIVELPEQRTEIEAANECSHGERCLDVRCECDCHDNEVVPLTAPLSQKCGRCGVIDQRVHLRGMHGCNHGDTCCEPAPQFEALLAREMTTLIRELEEVLAA